MATRLDDLTPTQKAAVALMAMGRQLASEVLRRLTPAEVEQLTVEIATLRDIPAELGAEVLTACHELFKAREYLLESGVPFARDLLEQAVGSRRADEVLSRLETAPQTAGFRKLQNIDSRQLFGFVRTEHPQTIALILTQVKPQVASAVLAELPAELQSDVALRVATMERISPEVLAQLETVLERQFDSSAQSEVSVSGGAKQIAEILNLVDSATEKRILQKVGEESPDLAMRIKNLMFVFEDLVLLDDRSIQRMLKEVETGELTVALKAASDELKQRILGNLSERIAGVIQEEMEYLGPMRLSQVEAAQQRIVETVRRLEDEGQIIGTGRGTREDVVI